MAVSHSILPSVLFYLLPSSSLSTSSSTYSTTTSPPLRNTSLYPACMEDTDCENDRRCFQYMCYPWQARKNILVDHQLIPTDPLPRPQQGSGGVASAKTAPLFCQRKAATIGKSVKEEIDAIFAALLLELSVLYSLSLFNLVHTLLVRNGNHTIFS